MKISQLKILLKEVVREVFQEELKSLLLEAIKSPMTLRENNQLQPPSPPPVPNSLPNNSSFRDDLRQNYANLINEHNGGTETLQPLTKIKGYQVPRGTNTAGPASELPAGEVSLEQIAHLTGK